MNDTQLATQAHMLIHSLRLISGYKPSEAEKKLSRAVIERYKDDCEECKKVEEELKNVKPKQGFLTKLGGIINDTN